jgi:uncharacterized protein YxjI
MGIISKIVELTAIGALYNVSEKKNKSLRENTFENLRYTEIFAIKDDMSTRMHKFKVYDKNENVKYTVKNHKKIYDTFGKNIGIVKKKRKDFIFEAYGETIGKLKSIGRQKYKADFNDWQIDGDVLQWNYKIFDRNGSVANIISRKFLNFTGTYVVTYPDIRNELMVLMVVTALDLVAVKHAPIPIG